MNCVNRLQQRSSKLVGELRTGVTDHPATPAVKPKAVPEQHCSGLSIISVSAWCQMTQLRELVHYHKYSCNPLRSFGQMSDSLHRDRLPSLSKHRQWHQFPCWLLCKFLLRCDTSHPCTYSLMYLAMPGHQYMRLALSRVVFMPT